MLRDLARAWEQKLQPRLTPCQRDYIQAFATSGAALEARVSRLLARLLLFSVAPANAILDQESGRPVLLHCPPMAVAFSHSGVAAFCAVAWGDFPLAIDAELCHNRPDIHDIGAFLAKVGIIESRRNPRVTFNEIIRAWTFYEALIKIGANRFPNLALRRGSEIFIDHGMKIAARFMSFCQHTLCMAAGCQILNPAYKWLENSKYLGVMT